MQIGDLKLNSVLPAAVSFLSALLLPVSGKEQATYTLKATPKTVAWGYHDAEAVPVLHVKSGDTVEISDTESPTVPSAWKMQACRRNRWTNRCATSPRAGRRQ